MDDLSTLVAQQYEAYCYPDPVGDLDAYTKAGNRQEGDPSLFGPMLWPEGRRKSNLRILSAGCGTTQAPALAYANRECEVVGVDLSQTSLTHARRLQERHNITNLRLEAGDLREVAQFGADFDLIFCSGVLHHMENPAEGLNALRDVLNPGGAMVLMLYGSAGRTGVYMLQDAFKRLGARQDPVGVALVRDALKRLPDHHSVQHFLRHDVASDASLVDAFLHYQDRAYSVPEVLGLVEAAGLDFQSWLDPIHYYAGARYPTGSPLGAAITVLPEREQWAVTEMLSCGPSKHTFIVRKPGQQPRNAISFERDGWENLIPHRHPALVLNGNSGKRYGTSFRVSGAEAALLASIDSKRAIIELAYPDADTRQFFEAMWRLGHLMISYR